MAVLTLTQQDIETAGEVWSRYQSSHELSDRSGQTAGIDPKSGRVWLGESIPDVIAQRDKEGLECPLYFERVGSDTYYRKGGRR